MSEGTGLARRMSFAGTVAWIAGAVSGLLGGLVGNQGGLRSAALLGFDLSKHSFVGTATAIGLVVDGARMPVYMIMQARELAAMMMWIGVATLGVADGTVLGSRVLARIPEMWFHRLLAIVLALFGAAMLWGGRLARSGLQGNAPGQWLIREAAERAVAPQLSCTIQAAGLTESILRNHAAIWFQLVKFRLTIPLAQCDQQFAGDRTRQLG